MIQVKPSTSTGSDKPSVEPPTANIKPLGPTVNKPQPVRLIFCILHVFQLL
jgi:nucleoprotein TPR